MMKAKQIMPAPGWGAALVHCHYDDGMRLYNEPLVGWALTEVLDGEFEGDTRVEGVIVCPGLDYTILCHQAAYETSEEKHGPTYFCGYVRSGQNVQDYYKDAERTYERWRHAETRERRLLKPAGRSAAMVIGFAGSPRMAARWTTEMRS